VLALALVIANGTARQAFGHAVNATIYLYGSNQTTGADNHYWTGSFCSTCAWRYYLQTQTTVYQSYAGQGNFEWITLWNNGGNVFSGGTAFYGHNTWVFDGNGTAHFMADYFCQQITPYSGNATSANLWNNGSSGYWTQDSAFATGTNCNTAFTSTDKMAIQAGS
jgi:hypothetical protein